MRISDWSSDVCSSDLVVGTRMVFGSEDAHAADSPVKSRAMSAGDAVSTAVTATQSSTSSAPSSARSAALQRSSKLAESSERTIASSAWRRQVLCDPSRSEEHTSDIQSLMRISYAVY